MTPSIEHLVIAPILLPLATAAVLVPFDDRRKRLKAAISFASTVATLGVALALLGHVAEGGRTSVYFLGNWPAPFGIVLVADRLAAVMLSLAAIVILAGLTFSIARWHRAGSQYHPLVQFLLAGLNGVFLTGDLFNLFVFFEISLAASYGLVLHGSGEARVKAGFHYIAVNLAASSLFLIGVSIIYGATGTLNMADLASRVTSLATTDRMLLHTGAAVLGTAFLVKAGMWPLCFWLPGTYPVVATPVAAMFSIMTKVGVYVILRLWLLVFGAEAGLSAHFGQGWLLAGGIATVVFGCIGLLASQDLPRLASFSVIVSSGTLLAVMTMDNAAVTGGALFYLVSSTLAVCALFLLIELIERGRVAGADVLAVTADALAEGAEDPEPVGVAIPTTMAILGGGFVACALLLAGLPPLTGFAAKVIMLAAMFHGGTPPGAATWTLLALLMASGFAVMVGLMRAGIRVFWVPIESAVPSVRLLELGPVIGLLLLCGGLTVLAGPVAKFMQAAAESLHARQSYVRQVLPASGAPEAVP